MATKEPEAGPEHPVIAAMKRAPVGGPFPPDVQAYLDHRMEEIKAGRARLVAHDRSATVGGGDDEGNGAADHMDNAAHFAFCSDASGSSRI
jgi:hypothetical protein